MREVITKGKSLDEIKDEYAAEWSCSPEDLVIEVIEKPGIFNRNWKVKIVLPANALASEVPEENHVSWDGTKYTIALGKKVETVIPFPTAGKLLKQGKELKEEHHVLKGETLEFYPVTRQGGLTWNIDVLPDGSKAVAAVKHEHSGRYVLSEDIPPITRIFFEKFIIWESTPDSGEQLTEDLLKRELNDKGIIYGIKPNLWVDFLTVDGGKEILIAEYSPAIQPTQPQLIDYVGDPAFENEDEDDVDKIDFFASKLRICQKDELLAKKIPGKEGTPGVNIFGQTLTTEKFNDFHFKVKKNAYVSEDGLEVRASCSGTPLRVNNNTYVVENAYILNRDVDLETGSIDFPGDVSIGRDVKEGLSVNSGGKILVQGSVSGASLKAEAGLAVRNNIIASRIAIGEKHVFRSQLLKGLREINEDLSHCVIQVEQLQNVSGNPNVGQLLKIIIEKNFQQLPKKTEDLETLLSYKDPDYVSQELEIAVKTIKHFLTGLGPLQLKNLIYLKNSLKVIGYFLFTKGDLIPGSVICETNYVQNSEINCSGDFICRKGIYNSEIKIEGSIKILGVCRGGEINCAGDIYIWELGGSCMSTTTIRAGKNSRLKIDFCHPNIWIYVGKELVRIDESIQKLDIYREKGMLQVEKLKWDGRN